MARNRAVLIVEDDVEVRALEVLILTDLGCVPCVARDALEALALTRSLAGQLALVLANLDIEPFDGVELALRLAVDEPQLGVIITCCCREDISRRALPPNVRGILVKPFEVSELAQIVGEAVRPEGGEG